MKKILTVLLTLMMAFSLCLSVSADDEENQTDVNNEGTNETNEVVELEPEQEDVQVEESTETQVVDPVIDETLATATQYTLTFDANGGTVKDNNGNYVSLYKTTLSEGDYILNYRNNPDKKRDNMIS